MRLARLLRRRLGFVGAETFVQRRGAPLILAALHDGVLVRMEKWDAERGAYRPDGRELAKGVKQPAAFLRWLVDQVVREMS